jgi:hypothetical protein
MINLRGRGIGSMGPGFEEPMSQISPSIMRITDLHGSTAYQAVVA